MIERAFRHLFALLAGLSTFVVFILLAPSVIAVFFFPWGTLYAVIAFLVSLPFIWVMSSHSDFLSEQSSQRKVAFGSSFQNDPVSFTSLRLFEKLSGQEVRQHFAIFAEQEDYDYQSILSDKIDRLEADYSSNTREVFFRMTNDLKYSGAISPVARSFHYQPVIMDHYANICAYLKRTPITELVDDIEQYQADLIAKRELANEAKRTEAIRAREENLAKREFFAELIHEFESSGLERIEIEKKVQEAFSKKFYSKPERVFRLNGVWHLQLSGQKFTLNPSEIDEVSESKRQPS